jgi:hypothetical protein
MTALCLSLVGMLPFDLQGEKAIPVDNTYGITLLVPNLLADLDLIGREREQ